MTNPIRIHRLAKSGHCHRVELFARLAGVPFELIDVDLAGGEHTRAPFLALNPAGQVPVIEDGAVALSDSNAILVYLARAYAPDWIPAGALVEADVQKFLSLAAGEIANGPAAARLVTVFGAKLDVERAFRLAAAAFSRLEAHLEGRDWLVAGRPTIADVAIYSYTAHAPEGGVSLDPYPRIRALLARIEALPGFVGMPPTVAGLVSEAA
ncbi:glutathione S-transferase family protein [Rubrimonas cliftonensis]|uniref:Glutathione S-transferase n=1 Tax=Rubrimonas cliftonensis TaxID=89524 RepID=A0A1H4EK74_9RHOB|nr:glutathione S-transferase [Rubrimonas cliftonensis]SEA85267.1 glutathione S-transferase [Rubrimonas cliftonensis]